MVDDNTTTTAVITTEAAQEEVTTSPADDKKFTQAEYDTELKRAKDSIYAEVRRNLKPKRQEEVRQAKDKAGDVKGADPDLVTRRLTQNEALDDAIGDRAITGDRRRRLRELLRQADPDEPHTWLETYADILLADSTAEKVTNSQTSESSVSQKKPGDVPGPSIGAPPWERPTNPFAWTESDVSQLVALKGAREAHRIIRQKAESFARTMRIQMAPQRR